MKNIIIKIFFFFVTLLFMDCKKENKVPSETPMSTFMKNFDKTVNSEILTGESGFTFESKVPGKIIKIGCIMPEPGQYKVSIFDYTSKNSVLYPIIASKTIEIKKGFLPSFISINEIKVKPGQQFGIMVRIEGTKKGYKISYNFSKILGSIKIDRACHSKISNDYCWDSYNTTHLMGLPDIMFVPD